MSASFFSTKDPFLQFDKYFLEATEKIRQDPNAFQLATVDGDGQVSVRTLLFKGFVRGGFAFYTNYQSRKSRALAFNSRAAMNFYWPELNMQIRIEGNAEKLTRQESAEYFASRPRLSQIGAWASEQSTEIPDLSFLEKKVLELEKKFAGRDIPCPETWGGFHLIPNRFEFWFSRQGRLHERYVYFRKSKNDTWQTVMLSP